MGTQSYGLYMNLANINEQEGEELKVPTVRLLERVKRTLELLEKGRVVEKNAIKNGYVHGHGTQSRKGPLWAGSLDSPCPPDVSH